MREWYGYIEGMGSATLPAHCAALGRNYEGKQWTPVDFTRIRRDCGVDGARALQRCHRHGKPRTMSVRWARCSYSERDVEREQGTLSIRDRL